MNSHLWLPQASAPATPGDFSSYLLGTGWSLTKTDESWATFERDADKVAVEVPQRTSVRDYARLVGFLLDDLARVEARPASSILRDVKASSMDVVRLGIQGSSTRDGRIPVEAGMRAYEAARDLLLAAACSVIDSRQVFANRKPDEAMKLLSHARFGQTEVGSFVITIECSIAPRLQRPLLEGLPDFDAPFERKTCLRLANALQATIGAAQKSVASNEMAPFRDGAQDGVSANLCEAIAQIFDATEADLLETSFSFAPRRPVEKNVPRRISFSSDLVPVLRAGASGLRDEATYPGTDLLGAVVKLESPAPLDGGEVVLSAYIDGRMRNVRIKLSGPDYSTAVSAHREGVHVSCVGDLKREGRGFSLRNATDVRVARDPELS